MVDRETLTKYADDSEVTVASWNDDEIVLRIHVDSHGGEVWLLRIKNVCHVDMASCFILGSTAFGGQELLPPDYLINRNKGYDGDEGSYHIIRFTDVDENNYFIIGCEDEVIEKEVT
jgi:hypothetical protein